MRKKYLSALLFGALLFASAGTFTSCKDYDDDINNLQSQIDKLATKEDMEAKLSQMETAINDAKATAEEALKAAQEAGSTEEIAKLEARIKALEDAALDVDALKKEIADSVEEQMADFREEMEELLKKVEELTGYSLEMVTSIDLQTNDIAGIDTHLDLNYWRISEITLPDGKTEPSYEFGKDLTGAFTIKKGDIYTVKDYILASVAPVNAAVDASMVSLMNSQAKNLDQFVTYTSEDYNDLLKSRSAANGLREIGVQLKSDVDFEAFHKLVSTAPEGQVNKDGFINYALAVTDAEKERTVTSTYDITIKVEQEENAVNVGDASWISSDASVTGASLSDYSIGADDKYPGDEKCYPAKLGEAFYIGVRSENPKGRVMASYVVVDYDNKELSATDVAAIKGLSFSGVNQVSKDNDFTITISGEHSGIVVPLKVVSIDYRGKIEENVVWVKAGKEAVGLTASYTATPAVYVSTPKAYQINTVAAFTIPEKAATYSLDLTVGENNHTDKKRFYIEKEDLNLNTLTANTGENILQLFKNADGTGTASEIKEVSSAKFVGTVNLNSMKEDVTYTGVIKFYDDKGTYLSTNEIKVTKKLPTAVPSYFSAKTNAINNGVLTVYPNPANGKGEFDLNRAFNGLGENLADKFELSSAALTTDGLASLSYNKITDINPAIINDGKTYAAAMSYNYGKIEYQPVGAGVAEIEDYKVKWNTDFAIKFGCVPVDSKYTWTGSTPVVYYKEDKTINPVTKYNEDGSAAVWGDFLTVKDPYGQTINPFSNTNPSADWNWGIWSPLFNNAAFDADPETGVKIELITNGDKVNEFFTAKIVNNPTTHSKYALQLTQTSTAVVLSGDVETTVVFKFKDKFGHDHAIKALTFTMKKDHNE